MAFDAAEIAVDLSYQPGIGGQRRTLVEQYYHTLNWTRRSDVLKFLAVAEGVVAEMQATSARTSDYAEGAAAELHKLLNSLARDGWEFEDGSFNKSADSARLSSVADSVERLDAPELQRQLTRLRASVETDPALTLGTAKELVETVCKTILEARDKEFGVDWDLGRLVKETRETLRLLPTDIPDSAKGADSIKRLLANLGAVVQGLGELRNLYGTGHGKSGKRRTIESRHARLAASAAGALVTFLLETHWDRE